MPSKLRLQRIADRIQQELSELLIQKINDPRLEGIFITGVKVDRELTYADVFISAIEGVERSAAALQGMQHAGGFLRHELASRVELRSMPRLRFHWDPTPENADHIERLIATLHANEQGNEAVESSAPEEQDD